MKFCMLAVYARIVDKSPEFKWCIKYIWATLLLTWVGAMVITFFECRPFSGSVLLTLAPCVKYRGKNLL